MHWIPVVLSYALCHAGTLVVIAVRRCQPQVSPWTAGDNDLFTALVACARLVSGGVRSLGSIGIDGAGGVRADGPCVDDINRYVDCANGTVTDTVTGLIWLKQAECLANTSWAAANQVAGGLQGSVGASSLTEPHKPHRRRAGNPRHPERVGEPRQGAASCVVVAERDGRIEGHDQVPQAEAVGLSGCLRSASTTAMPLVGPSWRERSTATETRTRGTAYVRVVGVDRGVGLSPGRPSVRIAPRGTELCVTSSIPARIPLEFNPAEPAAVPPGDSNPRQKPSRALQPLVH